jgi:uncharacterized protein YciI
VAERKCFFIRLIAPRPTFAFDQSESEKKLMQEHVAYWQEMIKQGYVVFFGPVFAPEPFGLAIVEVEDETMPERFMKGDPTTNSTLGFKYEIYSMRAGFVRKGL